MHNSRKAGYKRRKLELKVANRHRNGEISKETYRELMDMLAEGETQFVRKALHDPAFKLGQAMGKERVSPINLTWEEADDLQIALEDTIASMEDEYSEERLMNLENVLDKTWNAKQ